MFTNPQKNLSQFGVAEGLHIADFGAGIGYYTIPAAELAGKNGVVYAIEFNRDFLPKIAAQAKERRLQNVKPLFGDIEKKAGSNLAPESVDAVIISNVFFSLDDKEAPLEEAKRILRKKGRVLFVEWSDSFGGIGPHANHVVKKETAQALFEKLGFSYVKEIDAGEHHYGFIWRKS